MAIDLLNDDGELDRRKVINEIRLRCRNADERTREDQLIDLMDEVHQRAWQEGNVTGLIEGHMLDRGF